MLSSGHARGEDVGHIALSFAVVDGTWQICGLSSVKVAVVLGLSMLGSCRHGRGGWWGVRAFSRPYRDVSDMYNSFDGSGACCTVLYTKRGFCAI